jgi:O-methyltransferase
MKLNYTINYLKRLKDISKYSSVYRKYKEFTMLSQKEYIECLSLTAQFKNIEGCIIECGVWRGGMIGGIANVIGKDRNYYLFDSFEGLPKAKEIDGHSAIEWQKDVNSPGYYDNCKAEMEWAEKAMKKSGAENYKLVKGWFNETIPDYPIKEPIAVLRLDGDWYDSTMTCLEGFFNKVAKGGLIIIDDYYVWDGCSKALHDYLSKNQRSERIYEGYSYGFPRGKGVKLTGCYLVKN